MSCHKSCHTRYHNGLRSTNKKVGAGDL
jgi:hypothetical protein